jgi:hypothetical protein
MSEPTASPKNRIDGRTSVRLNRWYRCGVVTLGLASLGAGGVAVFATHLEAGPVALLGIGFLFLLIGMSGQLPTRLKFGDNEAVWEAVQGFVERVTESVPEENRTSIVVALDELAYVAPDVAKPVLEAMEYETDVMKMLRELSIESQDPQSPIPRFAPLRLKRQNDPPVDMLLEAAENIYIGVEVKQSLKGLSQASLIDMIFRLNSAKRLEPRIFRLLVICQEPLSSQGAWFESDETNTITVAVISGSSQHARLREIITRILTEASAQRSTDSTLVPHSRQAN